MQLIGSRQQEMSRQRPAGSRQQEMSRQRPAGSRQQEMSHQQGSRPVPTKLTADNYRLTAHPVSSVGSEAMQQ